VLLCTGIQRPQYSVTPSWHETTKNLSSLKIKTTPANANLQHTFTAYEEHIKTFIQHRNMQEKLLFVLNGKCLFLQGVPELRL
jgi:hypothetical protein